MTTKYDDYDVIVYRVLTYLYAVLKREIIFDDDTFQAAVRKNVESDEYFVSVLRLMQNEGLIEGLVITKAWGGVYLLGSDLRDAEITAAGIHYLKDNSTMKKVGDTLKAAADLIAELAALAGVFAG